MITYCGHLHLGASSRLYPSRSNLVLLQMYYSYQIDFSYNFALDDCYRVIIYVLEPVNSICATHT